MSMDVGVPLSPGLECIHLGLVNCEEFRKLNIHSLLGGKPSEQKCLETRNVPGHGKAAREGGATSLGQNDLAPKYELKTEI